MALATALALALASSAASAVTVGPKQPEKGAGGAEYQVAPGDIEKIAHGTGLGQVFVFKPAGTNTHRPTVVLFHAWNAMSPKYYGAWIEHLVRRGYVVLYPRIQEDTWKTQRKDATEKAVAALRLAFMREAESIDTAHVAFLGHAAGGIVAVNVAALASAEGLPAPKLVYAATPGNSWLKGRLQTPFVDLKGIAPETMIVTVAAENDNVAKDMDARRILRITESVPVARKMLIKMASDNHGQPTLYANMTAPMALNDAYDFDKIKNVDPVPEPEPVVVAGKRLKPKAVAAPEVPVLPPSLEFTGTSVDGLDWFGFWKTFDMALAASFAGADTSRIKTDPAFSSMGLWSDGWPVKRMVYESAREHVPTTPVEQPTASAEPRTRNR